MVKKILKKLLRKLLRLFSQEDYVRKTLNSEEGLTYILDIKVTCPDIPPLEDIPERITVSFKSADKHEAVQILLGAFSSHWELFVKDYKKVTLRMKKEK